ncbi:cytidylate kinase-like family protein [Fusobacterium simiae]|uniref:Cytidylate kinase-like family protein n=1 Tax=Fusobacterium simiae TaxID=855 RepID=A0ABT4DIJ9_FUSSI|nr:MULTISPECIES: cytidylate kinase-like family protein [Fusobacterium]MCY7007758.1 cytidylate kinase-like family protein [Fusobacterium simiae]MDC7955223.1 cytidylate kinase-like family protein [Fusobacterium simiae]
MNRIITIGREFGSGGRTIAKMIGEKLGIKVYDNELLIKIAEESGLAHAYVAERSENLTLSDLIGRSLSGFGNYNQVLVEDHLWKMQSEVILGLAEKETCIIVGRCADYILKEKANCLKVFIYASLEERINRIVSVYGESDIAPEKRLKDMDKRRSSFYNYFTDMKWGDPHNYDICLNSGILGFEKCVDIICSLY